MIVFISPMFYVTLFCWLLLLLLLLLFLLLLLLLLLLLSRTLRNSFSQATHSVSSENKHEHNRRRE